MSPERSSGLRAGLVSRMRCSASSAFTRVLTHFGSCAAVQRWSGIVRNRDGGEPWPTPTFGGPLVLHSGAGPVLGAGEAGTRGGCAAPGKQARGSFAVSLFQRGVADLPLRLRATDVPFPPRRADRRGAVLPSRPASTDRN